MIVLLISPSFVRIIRIASIKNTSWLHRGLCDIAVWRPGDGFWFILRSSDGGVIPTQWGLGSLNDVPAPGDYDGDGKTDCAVWRPGDGNWYILRSSDGSFTVTQWGLGALFDEPIFP